MCFPQNSSSASFMSSPFSADQPGPGPRDRLLLLCLLSPSTLPLHPPWGWLQLPGRWFPGLGSSLYSACGYLSCHCPSWDLHRRTFQPPRGRSYRRAWSLVSFSGPFFIPLPRLLPLAVPGLPLTPAILIPLSSLPIPPVTRRTLEPLWKLLLYPFSGSHPPCISCQGTEETSALPGGETKAPRPFSLQAWSLGGGRLVLQASLADLVL